ncbi:hypothetical protein R1sor_015162 [Riccia sorocarpa]|uniref:Ubiquitin-like protease family profile domain-containing protein n=1 Tax=Riccia sorocarpa TaxID=122646 RepID=A0ABD3HBZ1_9MARC
MDPLTVEVREEDIPVAAVQVIPTFVDDEVPLDENPVEVAPVLASDHGVDEGKILPEVVDVLDSQEAVPVIGEAQETTTYSLVDGWQDDGKFVQLVHDLTDTRNESQPVAEASTPNAVRNVEEEVATPGTAPNLEKVEFSVSEYLPIGSPAVTHDAQESGEIQDNREMMRAMNNFVEAASLEQICTASDATRRGIPESSTRAQEPSLGSGPSSGPPTGAEQEVLGPKSFSDRTVAGTDDTCRGLPMNVAIGVPFDNNLTRGFGEAWLRVDWTTVDKSRNIREIPVAERHAARVELWKHRTVFRGSLLYLEEPILRTDERVPRKSRAKKTSSAGSTPAEDETSPATKKTTKRKLNLDPPRSRSPSPEALERNQPPRNGKKKVEEGVAADMDRKGKQKVDDQPSTVPTKKNKRGDDSDKDSNKSNHAKGEAVQYTHFAALGKSEREKRQWGYKFINEMVQDKIQKRERVLKEQIEALEAKNAELQRQLREARDALADAMVGRRESSEPNHAAGPSIIQWRYPATMMTRRELRHTNQPSPQLPWALRREEPRNPDNGVLRSQGDLINTFMEETFIQLPPTLTGSRYLSTYWLPRVENLDVGKPGFLAEMEAAKKWILPSPVMDWADVPYMFIPIHGYLHWSLMVVRIITITPSHRQVRLYHLDSHPGIHLPSRVGTPVRSWLEHTIQDLGEPIKLAKRDVVRQVNTYDCGVHVMALTRSLIQLDDKLGWKLATNEIKDLVKIADVKQLRNEILAKVTGA